MLARWQLPSHPPEFIMASMRTRHENGMYYARLRYKDTELGLKKERSIPLMTKSKEIATIRLSYVSKMENEIKNGTTNLSSLSFDKVFDTMYSYEDINNESNDTTINYGYIYFIVTKDTINKTHKRVKIGFTAKRPSERLYDLESGSAVKLEIIGYMRGSPHLEKTIHKIFRDYNVHNEWYTYSYTMKELINCFKLKKERKKKECNV